MDKSLIAALREAKDRVKIEEIFKNFSSKSDDFEIQTKMEYLEAAMYNPQVFYSSGNKTSLEDKYELAIQRFLSRQWELRSFYEKAGLLKKDND